MKVTSTDDSTKHRAAVIIAGLVNYGNGTVQAVHDSLPYDIGQILAGNSRFVQHSTIVVDVPNALKAFQETAASKLAGGPWKFNKVDAWTLYYTDEGRTVAVGVRENMIDRHFGALFDKDTDAGVLAMLLDRYHVSTGNPWRGTAAMSALNAIRLTWENPQYSPLWNLPKECVRSGAGPIIGWRRPLNENERWWGWLHTFDANSAYLGSAISADLAWSRLHHVGAQPFDSSLPGYWLLDLPNALLAILRDKDRPPLLSHRLRDTCAWVTTPYAKFLNGIAVCDVVDSWVAQEGRSKDGRRRVHPAGVRILRGWGESQRDALHALRRAPIERVDGAVKLTYSNAVGGMQREGARVYRPDWGHTIVDLWRKTLLERVWRVYQEIGYWPVRIHTDSVTYADSTDDPRPLAKVIGARPREFLPRELGWFRHIETVSVDTWIERHETNRQRVGV